MANLKGITYYGGTPDGLHPVLEKHKKLLNEFADDRIFAIEFDGTNFSISEQCDEYYGRILTKGDCNELAEMFSELAEVISIL